MLRNVKPHFPPPYVAQATKDLVDAVEMIKGVPSSAHLIVGASDRLAWE